MGLALGLVGSAILAPLLASLLFRVPPRDPAVFLAVVAVLGTAALGSGFLPAWRAARTDPMEAMKGK